MGLEDKVRNRTPIHYRGFYLTDIHKERIFVLKTLEYHIGPKVGLSLLSNTPFTPAQLFVVSWS
jgi:hypothetical protein